MTDKPALLVRKDFGALRPANEAAVDAFAALSNGAVFRVKLSGVSPSVARMRLYWAVMGVAAENLADRVDGGLKAELLHEIVKRKLGLGRLVKLPSGDEIWDGASVSFAKMAETERSAVFDRVFALLAAWLGVDVKTLLDEARAREGLRDD